MVAAITWFVKTKPANPTFAGFVWALGNHTAARGTTVTVMTRTKPETPEMVSLKKEKLVKSLCSRYHLQQFNDFFLGQEKSRSALQRYLFYCNRYMNHLQSLKFENKLYSMAKVSK